MRTWAPRIDMAGMKFMVDAHARLQAQHPENFAGFYNVGFPLYYDLKKAGLTRILPTDRAPDNTVSIRDLASVVPDGEDGVHVGFLSPLTDGAGLGHGALAEYGSQVLESMRRIPWISKITVYAEDLPAGAVPYKNLLAETLPDGTRLAEVEILTTWKYNEGISGIGDVEPPAVTRTHDAFKGRDREGGEMPDILVSNMSMGMFGSNPLIAGPALTLPARLGGGAKIPTFTLHHDLVGETDLEDTPYGDSIARRIAISQGSKLLRPLIEGSDVTGVYLPDHLKHVVERRTDAAALLPYGAMFDEEITDFDFPDGDPVILSVGRYDDVNRNPEKLIRAVEQLRNQTGQNIRLVIAGSASPASPGVWNRLEFILGQNGSEYPWVELRKDPLDEELPELVRNSWMVVSPSITGTGSSGVQHMAASLGRAFVGPDIPQHSKIEQSEGYRAQLYGVIGTDKDSIEKVKGDYKMDKAKDDAVLERIDSLNIAALASGMRSLLEDEARARNLAEHNYRIAQAYPMDEIVQNWYGAFMASAIRNNQAGNVQYPAYPASWMVAPGAETDASGERALGHVDFENMRDWLADADAAVPDAAYVAAPPPPAEDPAPSIVVPVIPAESSDYLQEARRANYYLPGAVSGLDDVNSWQQLAGKLRELGEWDTYVSERNAAIAEAVGEALGGCGSGRERLGLA